MRNSGERRVVSFSIESLPPPAAVAGIAGSSEQNAEAWWAATRAIQRAVAAQPVQAVALSGQMQSVVLLDGAGAPLRPALLYSDTRATAEAAALVASLGVERLRAGAINWKGAASTLPKLLWLLAHGPTPSAAPPPSRSRRTTFCTGGSPASAPPTRRTRHHRPPRRRRRGRVGGAAARRRRRARRSWRTAARPPRRAAPRTAERRRRRRARRRARRGRPPASAPAASARRRWARSARAAGGRWARRRRTATSARRGGWRRWATPTPRRTTTTTISILRGGAPAAGGGSAAPMTTAGGNVRWLCGLLWPELADADALARVEAEAAAAPPTTGCSTAVPERPLPVDDPHARVLRRPGCGYEEAICARRPRGHLLRRPLAAAFTARGAGGVRRARRRRRELQAQIAAEALRRRGRWGPARCAPARFLSLGEGDAAVDEAPPPLVLVGGVASSRVLAAAPRRCCARWVPRDPAHCRRWAPPRSPPPPSPPR